MSLLRAALAWPARRVASVLAMRGFAAAVLGGAPAAAEGLGTPTKESRMRGALLGALVADSLSLATHYEYDAVKIRTFYGKLDTYYAPGEKTGGTTHGIGWGGRNFHDGNGNGPAKAAGELTDYGDYTMLIAEHLAATAASPRPLDVAELVPRWQTALATWRSWICTQTRATYDQVQRGMPTASLGGMSNAMAVRHAAALAYYADEESVAAAARAAMFTHREATALQGGEFFARVAYRVVHAGLTPAEAISAVAAEPQTPAFVKTKVQQALDKVREATDPASDLFKEPFLDDLAITSMARLWDVGRSEPIKVGKASPTEGTLPGSVYFIVKYGSDFLGAARANAEVGGDSASRAVAIGSVLGAFVGVEGLPAHLGQGALKEWDRAHELLDQMPLLRGKSSPEL
ncbi:ADP-ribosylation/Crystallin J1 [Pelagophyceae sp. CCMP2097]|nr:ADP-ribosylation/Crystallin J1 [Pelagophyceae sp. CCMP2097]